MDALKHKTHLSVGRSVHFSSTVRNSLSHYTTKKHTGSSKISGASKCYKFLMWDVWVLGGARTPFALWAGGKLPDGSSGGAFKSIDPFDLGAAALRGALERSRTRAESLGLVLFSQMYAVGAHACYGARYVAHRAGVPPTVPCLSPAMSCGSGLYALLCACQEIASGSATLAAAGGSENVSMVRRDVLIPSFKDISCDRQIAKTVEDLALEFGIGRAEQDAWALRSHRRAAEARLRGRTAEELVKVAGLSFDDAVLPEADASAFSAAEPTNGEGGMVTAANSHRLVDGAAALILCAAGAAPQGTEPLGRIRAGAYAATAPHRMAYASVPAVERLLSLAGLRLADIDLFEINETFAAQTLLDLRQLGIAEDRVNVNGGAIAFGHPFAATGCRQVLSLLLELRRRGLKRGVASICIGGGQGIALLLER